MCKKKVVVILEVDDDGQAEQFIKSTLEQVFHSSRTELIDHLRARGKVGTVDVLDDRQVKIITEALDDEVMFEEQSLKGIPDITDQQEVEERISSLKCVKVKLEDLVSIAA